MNLLSVRGLNLAINDQPILEDLNFTIDAGEILGVIGESGSGKSMTAYSIMQLLPRGSIATGAITLEGKTLLNAPESVMCSVRGDEIGMIFQEPMTALNPLKTIGEQVAETILIHGKADKAAARTMARDTLERVELPEHAFPLSRYPHELSGGQRQRVVIAMAIALRPRLLIADEPTTALDVTTQAEILQLLKRLVKEDNLGLMMITHDLAVVSSLADRIIIMRRGNILERGAARTLHRDKQHPYTTALFNASRHVPTRDASTVDTDNVLLSVKNVVRDYRLPRKRAFGKVQYFRAINDVSFQLYQGENLGLIGESGCGKSTLTRAILGLEPVQAGHIHLNDENVYAGKRVDRQLRRKMQVVFQDPYSSFNPRHKVLRLVSEPMHLLAAQPDARTRREQVENVLLQVGMHSSDADKYIHEFSGGQRQRIAIARALVIKPRLIVLDEAVSALDVSIRAQILDLLADLSDRFQLSYLFISHDLSVVRSITDRVLIMKSGEIVEQGRTEAVFNHPEHPYTRALIAAAPFIKRLIKRQKKAQTLCRGCAFLFSY